ncbi:unnamed protein product [Mytilus edulis]|uniref:Peptidase S1 domain-containing protein n=1 Tax=Mytilus edulis TaxID=6550 RepID=A0A8S3UXU3_MYTED|nr:unnamed protein product [Mytilus edulis]
MEHSDTCCVHCTHVFNVENLKEERRRSVGKQHKDVDLIKTLAFCYEVDEVKLRNAIGYDETSFFRLHTNLSVSREQFDADEQINEDTELPLPSLTPALACLGSTARKRQRNIFTPSKSGCTPKAKRKASTKTPKKNRRRLQFTSTCKSQDEKPKPQVTQSPGPKVKVHLQFKGSSRKTDLKGPGKLACRSIVQKQYTTALNHLLTIEDAKKELVNTVKKNISREVQALCKNKESTFRGSNISRFFWKSAKKELERNCPLTLEILNIVAGKIDSECSIVIEIVVETIMLSTFADREKFTHCPLHKLFLEYIIMYNIATKRKLLYLWKHEKYYTAGGDSIEPDLMLLQLKTPLKFGSTVNKIDLDTDTGKNYTGELCTISGWGTTNATGLNYDKNSRDSGGPLVCSKKLVGVLSFGPITPCDGRVPSVHIRVSAYTDWIKEKLKNKNKKNNKDKKGKNNKNDNKGKKNNKDKKNNKEEKNNKN